MPSYLNCLVHHRAQIRCLRYNANKLTVPPFKLDFGSRGFCVAALTVWNALPDYIRACTSPSLFSRELKTFICVLLLKPSSDCLRASDSMYMH
jgi:hypothetical protein